MLNKTPEIVIRHVTWVYVKYLERDGQSRLPESKEVSICSQKRLAAHVLHGAMRREATVGVFSCIH